MATVGKSAAHGAIPAVTIAGVVAELLLLALKPSAERPRAMRAFAFLVP